MTKRNAQGAQSGRELAQDTARAAESGAEEIVHVDGAVQAARQAVVEMSGAMREMQTLGLSDIRTDDLFNVSGVRKGTGGGPTTVPSAVLLPAVSVPALTSVAPL